MRIDLKESLLIARKRERKDPTDKNILKVRKLIYQAKLNSNNFAQDYKEKHSL